MSSVTFLFELTNGCRMFNQQELQVLLGGVNIPVDINDLRQNTNYGGLYDDQEPTIVAFWKVGSCAPEILSFL
jgi:HECT-domain (ubiquitin-transferase)